MEIIECEQGSPEWHAARMGIPTASEFHTVLARGKDGGASVTRRKYMRRLAGEILTGKPAETFQNHHMERGIEMEHEARLMYSFMENAVCERVGFVIDRAKRAGCSPDSLIGTDKVLEIKTKIPELWIEFMDRDDFPPDHKAQCQGELWLTKREVVDIAVYWPDMPKPILIMTARRDEAYIAKLASEIDKFNAELHELVQRIRMYGSQEKAA